MYSIKRDIILEVKHSFLRFLQGYFSGKSKYKWDQDIRLTKIIIVDKNAIDLGIPLQRPAIILNRNNFGWSYTTGTQNSINTSKRFLSLDGNQPSSTRDNLQSYTDLIQGNITISILSKNGVEAERLAAVLFTILTGYKDALRKDGIHKVTNISVGPEQILRVSSEHELINININLNYYSQQHVEKGESLNNITIYLDGEVLEESMDYKVSLDGASITFLRTLDVSNPNIVTADYIDAITLNVVNNEELSSTADPLTYSLVAPGTIQGYYTVLSKIVENIVT